MDKHGDASTLDGNFRGYSNDARDDAMRPLNGGACCRSSHFILGMNQQLQISKGALPSTAPLVDQADEIMKDFINDGWDEELDSVSREGDWGDLIEHSAWPSAGV